MDIKRGIRNVKRLEEILLVLFENGFGYMVNRMKLLRFIPLTKRLKKRIRAKEDISNAARFRLTLEKLGPTFIKFGQLLSLRPDLLPKEYIKELEKLQDKVPSFEFSKARKIIEAELKSPIEKVFSKFDKEPIASASISQVYKAALKNKKGVAVKVRRPKIKHIMDSDIEIMLMLANLLEKHFPKLRKYKPTAIVNEFQEWTKRELDLRKEARNAEKFYNYFKGSKTVRIPKIYREICTKKVFVAEFLDGTELHDINKIKRKSLNVKKIMKNGCEAMLKQVFVDGFFHADPHPGNILILKDNRIAFVDFGIVGYFNQNLKEKAVDIVYGVVNDQPEKVVDALLDIGIIEKEDINVDAFKRDLHDVIEDLQASRLKNVKLSSVLENVLGVALNYRVKMPVDFVLFGKTIVTLEGLGLQYDPDFRIIDVTKPFVERLMLTEKPKYMAKEFIGGASRLKDIILSLPAQTYDVMRNLGKGNIKVGIEDAEIRRLGIELDRSSNRLVYGMIIAAFVIGSAWTVNMPGDPRIWGLHVLSFSFLAGALLVSLILLVSISQERYVE